MESVTTMGRLYNFGRPDKMSVPVHTPPSPPEVKYNDDISLGPYYAHYWSLVGNNLENDGMPIASNGAYISPYGSAPEPFFPELQEAVPQLEEVPWSGVNGVGDGLFTHSRSTSYGHMGPADPYTPPMDSVAWGQFTSSSDPVLQIQSLPALENLANQILTTLISGTADDFVNTITSPDDEGKGQAYATVEALFEQQKRIFSRGRLFIDPNAIPLNSPVFPRVARKANLATFVTCIFRGQDIPFLELDEAFLDIFMPAGSRLLKSEGALYLELKTQAFITIMMNGGTNKDDVLDKLFPTNLQIVILRRRPEPTHLAPSEADFISRVSTRKQYLSTGASTLESLSQLPQKYNWKGFLEEVSSCVRKVLETMDSIKEQHHGLGISAGTDDPITKATLAAHAAIHGHHPHHAHHRSISINSGIVSNSVTSSPYSTGLVHFSDSPASLASGRSFRTATSTGSPTTPTTQQMSMYPPPPPNPLGRTSHPTSSPSTNSTSKAGANGRRPNAPSPRRPWTQEEERALLEGLERVKGPHWSQILALYGAGGSVSEVLKDRNQVQLKDKARNLKLFYLKSGVEVPGFLKRVTGELRTRAPGQAARRERERRRQEEEERLKRERDMSGVVKA